MSCRIIFLTAAVLSAVVFSGCVGETSGEQRQVVSRTTDSFGRGDYRLELNYPAEAADFGSDVRIVLAIQYPEGESYILLPPDISAADSGSNTRILSIEEGDTIYDGSGIAETLITFRLEAWLPGEIALPPLTILLGPDGQELTTDMIVIQSQSAFDETAESGEAERDLAPLYIPESSSLSRGIVAPLLAATAAVTAAAAAVVIIRRRKKNARRLEPQPKSRLQLLVEFRLRYIDTPDIVNLREAFTEIEPLLGAEEASRYGSLIEEARFSKDCFSYDEGYRLLVQLFGQLYGTEVSDEL